MIKHNHRNRRDIAGVIEPSSIIESKPPIPAPELEGAKERWRATMLQELRPFREGMGIANDPEDSPERIYSAASEAIRWLAQQNGGLFDAANVLAYWLSRASLATMRWEGESPTAANRADAVVYLALAAAAAEALGPLHSERKADFSKIGHGEIDWRGRRGLDPIAKVLDEAAAWMRWSGWIVRAPGMGPRSKEFGGLADPPAMTGQDFTRFAERYLSGEYPVWVQPLKTGDVHAIENQIDLLKGRSAAAAAAAYATPALESEPSAGELPPKQLRPKEESVLRAFFIFDYSLTRAEVNRIMKERGNGIQSKALTGALKYLKVIGLIQPDPKDPDHLLKLSGRGEAYKKAYPGERR